MQFVPSEDENPRRADETTAEDAEGAERTEVPLPKSDGV